MSKVNVVLDSCVFFFSLGLFDIYKNSGRDEFNAQISILENDISNIKSQLIQLVGDKYYNKHKNDSFEKMLDEYKSNINSLIKNADRMINAYTDLVNGFTRDGSGNRLPINLPPQAIEQKKHKIEELKNQKQILENVYKTYIEMRNDYTALTQQLYAGKVIERYLNGEIGLCLVEDGYREILNHIGSDDEMVNFKTFSQQMINQLLSECVLVSIREKDVLDAVETLSKEYRTSHITDGSRMKDDINSLGAYGDSRIMAEANLAGLVLLTFNKKDFIFDKSGVYNNSQIRENTNLVNNMLSQITSDALPYTPEEFIKGEYKLPARRSEKFGLVPVKQQSQTKGIVELCVQN